MMSSSMMPTQHMEATQSAHSRGVAPSSMPSQIFLVAMMASGR